MPKQTGPGDPYTTSPPPSPPEALLVPGVAGKTASQAKQDGQQAGEPALD